MSFRMNAIVLRVVENRIEVGDIKEIESAGGEIRKIKVTKIHEVWLASDGTIIAEIDFKDVK